MSDAFTLDGQPVPFTPGRTGRLFIEFALALAGAVVVSGFVALTLTPYLGYIFLREKEKRGHGHEESKGHRLEDSGIYKIYKSFINPLLNHRWKRYTFIFGTVAILLASLALFAWRAPRVGLGGRFEFVSRESALLANNVLLLVAAALVSADVVVRQRIENQRLIPTPMEVTGASFKMFKKNSISNWSVKYKSYVIRCSKIGSLI